MKKCEIINSDCFEVFPKFGDDEFDLILTDIPYNQTNDRENWNLRDIQKGKADELDFSLEGLLEELTRLTNNTIYIFCATEQVSFIRAYLDKNDWTTRLCIWEKTNPSPQNGEYLWLSGIETFVFGIKPQRDGGNPTFNEHCENTVFRYSTKKETEHPTEKSLELFKRLIKASSNKNYLVLDPFLGSGTTALACKQLGRDFVGIEKEEEFVEMAKERMKQEVLV